MSDEIKMSHMFAIPVRQHYSVVVDRNENQCSYSTQVEYAAHAINNHDRLTEENKRLREALVVASNSIGRMLDVDQYDGDTREFINARNQGFCAAGIINNLLSELDGD